MNIINKIDNRQYTLTKKLTIPKGTILDVAPYNKGGIHYRSCYVEIGKDFTGEFFVTLASIEDSHGIIKELE